MTISLRMSINLERHGANFDLFAHPHSRARAETARVAHGPRNQLAKPVSVEDEAGCVMAIVPGGRMDQPPSRCARRAMVNSALSRCIEAGTALGRRLDAATDVRGSGRNPDRATL